MFKSLAPGAIGVKADLLQGIAYARAGGFQGLDVSIKAVSKEIEQFGADYVKNLFADAGLQMGAWGLPIAWNGNDLDYRRGLKGLPALAEAGASVGATRVSQWVPPASDNRKFRENYQWHLNRFRPICEILAEYGCSLGLEFIGPQTLRLDKPFGFIYSIDGMLAFCEGVGTGNVGLLLDCWHWYTCLGSLADIRALVPSDVVHVHVNDAPSGVGVTEQIDNVRMLPSETGVIDLVGFLKELKEIGYEGPVSPEPFSQRVVELPPEEAVRETHEGLDEAWKKAGLS
jgi:sugar phosphate isomerase/epimerase